MFGLDQCIVPRKQANLSVKLQPILDVPFHNDKFNCNKWYQHQAKALEIMEKKNSEQILKIIKQRESQRVSAFQYVLKRLVVPHNKIISQPINILIPEVCIYKEGEADSLYMNVDPLEKTRQFGKKTDNKQKRQLAIVRVRKEKLTNTQIQKIFSQKRRKYREKILNSIKNIQLRLPIQNAEKKQVSTISEAKEAIFLTYTNGEQEILSENQFINLTLKRKQDPIFKKIEMLKNYIRVTCEQDERVTTIKHQGQAYKYEKLFKRSQILMKCNATNILPVDDEYISSEEENKFLEKLQKRSLDALAHYSLYKIMNFIQIFYDQRITEISARFLLNECSELYLMHVYSVKKAELVKYDWTQDIYMKKVGEEQNRFLERKVQTKEADQFSRLRSNKIQNQMNDHYEKLKIALGLAQVQKNDFQQKANNSFFSVIHPEIPQPISEILKDKSMTVTRFKENYLGFKHKKRSVAQSFNSNLVKTLHKMSPPLKVAKGHQIQDNCFPKTPGISTRTGKRSFSLGNTLSTVNKTMTLFH